MVRYEIKDCVENFQFVFPKLLYASYSIYESVFANTEYAYRLEWEWEKKGEIMEDVCTESFVTRALADNVVNDRLTGNGEGWGNCRIRISPYGVDYETGGGVCFGWDVSPDWDDDIRIEDTLTVYCEARPGGTLEKALVENGFKTSLNSIVKSCNVKTYGLPSLKGLEAHSNKDGYPVVISTLPAEVMDCMGIDTYYSPVIQQGEKFEDAYDIKRANLDINIVHVEPADEIVSSDQVVIASQHMGTVALLKDMYPNNTILASVTPDDIRDRDVVGTLPPHLIQYAARFKAFTIDGFDYNRDHDLEGEELKNRMRLSGTIKVSIS